MFGGKSDVAIPNLFSIECKTKTTHSESISIKREWFEKQKNDEYDWKKTGIAIESFTPSPTIATR